jgi:diacylglycerol kinase (ATP)
MPQHPVKLIVNPNADMGRAWHAAADLRPIVESFGGADWTGTVYPTHATELARQAAEQGYETVVAMGGDGTVHEVVNGLMQVPAGQRPRLGIVPLGTGNDFSSAAGVDRNPQVAMGKVFTGQPRRVDVGVLRDGRGRVEYWDNAVGIGFDTSATIYSRRITVFSGFLVYLIAVLQTIVLNYDVFRLQVSTDLESFDENLMILVLCNGGREGGGFFVSPEARVDDGVFHYTGIRKVRRAMMLRLLPEVMRGTHGRFPQTRMGQFHKLQLQSDSPLYIHTDGEIFAGFVVDVRQLEVEILPGALEVVV